MKRYYCFLTLLGLFVLFPTTIYAQDDPPGFPDDPPHLSPQLRPFFVSYDSVFNSVSIMFRDSIEQATVIINKDGILLDEDCLTNISPYSIYDYDLWLYGSGLFTIYIRIGERIYAVLEEEIEE